MAGKSRNSSYDVIIIGGGPGGSSAGTFLADYGKKVLLLEREKFPRYHIGESLLSGTLEIFSKLGVGRDLHALPEPRGRFSEGIELLPDSSG